MDLEVPALMRRWLSEVKTFKGNGTCPRDGDQSPERPEVIQRSGTGMDNSPKDPCVRSGLGL